MRSTRMRSLMSDPGRTALRLILVAALAAGGCGQPGGATAPTTGASFDRAESADDDRTTPSAPRNLDLVAGGGAGDPWYQVAKSTVGPLQMKTVKGSRYSLLFLPGSVLGSPIEVTIHERSPDIVDVQLGPHGAQFGVPVTLTIKYAGTPLDPAHPQFKPGPIQFYWLDPLPFLWVPIPGIDNPLTKTYTVTLSHFSRYTLSRSAPSGTADW